MATLRVATGSRRRQLETRPQIAVRLQAGTVAAVAKRAMELGQSQKLLITHALTLIGVEVDPADLKIDRGGRRPRRAT